MLCQLVSATKAVIPDTFTQLCVATMYMLALHGFMRIGEITVRAGVLTEHVIQRSDLEIVSGHRGLNKKPLCHTRVMPAKHQQVNRPIVLEITSQSPNFPVAHICRYLHTCGSSVGPLFIFPDKSPISGTYFASQLAACLYTQVTTLVFTSATCSALVPQLLPQQRVLLVQIQIMGRWKSAAFWLYIRIPMMQLQICS